MKLNIFVFTVAYLFQKDTIAWRSFDFNFLAIRCVKQSHIASLINCTLSKLPRKAMGLCFNLKFSQQMRKPNLDILIEITRQNQPNFVLANATYLDGCQFLEKRGLINIIQIIRENFDKFSNMPKKCPVAKDTILFVKDLVLDANKFPPYVPETTFIVTVKLWEGTIPVFEIVVNGNVKIRGRKTRFLFKNKA